MQLVNAFKSAAKGYGTERRVLLLHGPVGSSKSTIARLLKTRPGGLLAHRCRACCSPSRWKSADGTWSASARCTRTRCTWCPTELRPRSWRKLNEGRKAGRPTRSRITRRPVPVLPTDVQRAPGQVRRRLDRDARNEIKVYRLILSEQDRIGIGTFQPKDEKNQDSTELTGDINYRKIAEYGTDSDPRAFNFDGELNIANRGLVEFIEVLKLDVAFLYDLLGASQEHKIKPKKFAQTDIDEVILGHSVAGDTPIPYRFDGRAGLDDAGGAARALRWTMPRVWRCWPTILPRGQTAWTPVRAVFRHRFSGKLLTTSQKWGVVETTPNHSIYDRAGQKFYPDEKHEIMAVRGLADAVRARTACRGDRRAGGRRGLRPRQRRA